MSDFDFEKFKKGLEELKMFNTTEEYGMTITVGDQIFIILCNDPTLTPTEKKIILWHEKAHATGIIDEEEADKWALKNMKDDNAKDLLIQNWKHRHGHDF